MIDPEQLPRCFLQRCALDLALCWPHPGATPLHRAANGKLHVALQFKCRPITVVVHTGRGEFLLQYL